MKSIETFAKWYFERDAEYCEHCKLIHKDDPPCHSCKWGPNNAPALSSFGQEVFEIYTMVSNQIRSDMGAIYGLDYNVVFELFRILGIHEDDSYLYFKALKVFEAEYLKAVERKRKQNEKSKSNNYLGNQENTIVSRTIGSGCQAAPTINRRSC